MIGRTTLFWLLVALLALSPLPLGGARPWSIALIQTVSGVVVLVITLMLSSRRQNALLPLAPIGPSLALGLMVIIWALIQTTSWTPDGWVHPVWGMASEALGRDLAGSVAIEPATARFYAMLLLSYLGIFVAAYLVALDQRRATGLLWVVALVGAAYAAYGFVLKATGLPHVLYPPTELVPRSTGTAGSFGNENHFGLFLLMAVSAAFALLLVQAARMPWRGPLRLRLARGIEFSVGAGLPFVAVTSLILAVLLVTGSRGSVLLLMVLGVLMITVLGIRASRSGTGMAIALIGILATGFLGWTAVEAALATPAGVQLRSSFVQGSMDGTRIHIWKAALAMIGRPGELSWLLGNGLGSFPQLYALYGDGSFPGTRFDRAHNGYLGMAISLGVPAALMWLTGLALLMARCWAGVLSRANRHALCVPGALASLLMAVHACFDFGFDVPAIAILWAVLLGVGCAQASSSEDLRRFAAL